MPDPARKPTGPARPRAWWRTLLQAGTAPVFVLNPARRLRFVNAAWEKLAGRPLAEVQGMACLRRGPTEPLFRALAPPPEAVAGRVTTARRPAPPHAAGPPWWDVTFVPLPAEGGAAGFLGVIAVVGPDAAPGPPRKTPAAVAALRETHAAHFTYDLFAGPGPEADRLVARLRLAAQVAAPVWISGEPGTGKETLARVVHHQGVTRERAFVALDGRGLQPYLIDGLLFGHDGLAPSGKVGTVYLKEPAALPRDLQQRLADWFGGPKPAPRLVCGSTTPPADDVAAGRLLPEFLAAFAVLELHAPPLRDRPADLPRLVDRLLDRFPLPDGAKPAVSPEALETLRHHAWPGNVRELADVLAEATRLAAGGPVRREHLPRYVQERALLAGDPLPAAPKLDLDAVLVGVEKRLIALALKRAGGNQTEAAKLLGVVRARLGRRVEALGIEGKSEG